MNVEIANKLVKLRKQLGLSQEGLAEKIGVSRQAVSKWERSESSPDTDNLIALSKIYGISIDEMLNYDVDNTVVQDNEPEKDEDTKSGVKFEMNFGEDDEDENDEESKNPLAAAVPIMAVIVFMVLGLFWGLWHPGWLVFLLIPVIIFLLPVKINGKWTMKSQLRKLPYPVFVTFVFLLLGFIFNGWAWAWLVYLTIPIWAIARKN